MRRFALLILAAAAALAAAASASGYLSVKRKFDLIERERVPAGSTVVLGKDELNAWVREAVPAVAPQGVRAPRLELGTGRASGFAYVDFPKLRQAQGQPLNWFMARLLAGERPVRVDAHIRSAGSGKAQVDVDRVEVSGLAISGAALDYLIRNFLWSYYPEAKVGKPFELAHGIDRLDVRPDAVQVVMKGRKPASPAAAKVGGG